MMQRPALRLVEGGLDTTVAWQWFCGHCAASSPSGEAPAPTARVCTSCGLGLLLEAREDAVQRLLSITDTTSLFQIGP